MQMMLIVNREGKEKRFWTCRVGHKSDFNVVGGNGAGDEAIRTFLKRAVRDDAN